MALDIHKIENGKTSELLFSISDSLYSIFEPAFNDYKNKTGLYIDPYGKLKLSSGLTTLIEVLTHAMNQNDKHVDSYQRLINTLKNADKNNYGIIFEGD